MGAQAFGTRRIGKTKHIYVTVSMFTHTRNPCAESSQHVNDSISTGITSKALHEERGQIYFSVVSLDSVYSYELKVDHHEVKGLDGSRFSAVGE